MIASTTPRHSSTSSSVSVRIAIADLFGHPSKVVLDGPTGRVLEVHEQRPVGRVEHVPRVRLAVQQLLGGAPVDDRSAQITQRVREQRPIRRVEIGSDVTARHVVLRLRNAIHEVRRRDIDLPQASMKTPERLRVLGWRKFSTNGFEVRPHGDCESVTPEDAWLDPGVEPRNRAVVLGELLRNIDFPRQHRSVRWRRDCDRATTSHGVRRTTSRFESLRTTASSTAKPSAVAVDIAASTARRDSTACILGALRLLTSEPLTRDARQTQNDTRTLAEARSDYPRSPDTWRPAWRSCRG